MQWCKDSGKLLDRSGTYKLSQTYESGLEREMGIKVHQ